MFQWFVNRFIRPRWQIGILKTPLEQVVSGAELKYRWMANPFYDRWFADPFILSVDKNEVTLLVEDYRYKDNKGRISRIIVDMDRMAIVSCKTLLDNHHYSFPAILRKDGNIYIYPEQSREGKLDLFEYDANKKECRFVKTLSNQPLTDAIIYDGKIFSTKLQEANGRKLFCSEFIDEKGGEVALEVETRNKELSPAEEVEFVFDGCIARNAGDFFEVDGKIYRPAQECNRWYGNALSIQQYENGEFTEVIRIPGIHTINSYQGVTIVDKKVFPFKWLFWLLRRSDM